MELKIWEKCVLPSILGGIELVSQGYKVDTPSYGTSSPPKLSPRCGPKDSSICKGIFPPTV